jgi:hypothetical protein
MWTPNSKQWKSKESGHAPLFATLWRGVLELRDGTRKSWQASTIHTDLHKTNTRWLVHSWSTFGAKTSHGQIRTHKTHHGSDLGEATTFPLIVYFMPLHGGHIKWHFVPNLRVPRLWRLITFFEDLRLIWGLKQSYSPCWELSNAMSHATCTQQNRVDSWLLVVGNQIANLISDLSFDHNLCFKCPNGSCEPISDIYVPRNF